MPTGSPARIRVSGSGLRARGDDDRAAGLRDQPRRLRACSASRRSPARSGSSPARPSTSSSSCGTSGIDLAARPARAGVGPVEAVDHAEDDEQRRLEQVRDHRGEPVVVAELDLVDADRVVLVDDRDGVALEQRGQRVPHVQVAGPAVEVFVGQQELGGVPAVPAQALVVGADQVGLADGGRGLELAEVVGPALPGRAGRSPRRPPPS